MRDPRLSAAQQFRDDPRFPKVRIHESAYIDEPVTIGPDTSIWHFSHVLGHVRIGSGCSLGQNVVVGPRVTVGDNVKIQNNVSVYEGVTLEDGVFCGPSCVFTNVVNPRSEIVRKSEYRATLVKRGASIGANATIVCGHTLGAHCFIAAGAVIARDRPQERIPGDARQAWRIDRRQCHHRLRAHARRTLLYCSWRRC